jgi:hypothetical protein
MENFSQKNEILKNIKTLSYSETEVMMSKMKTDSTWLTKDKKDYSTLYKALIAHRAELENSKTI